MTKYSNTSSRPYCILVGCTTTQSVSEKKTGKKKTPVWEAASVYFLMTDRFYNGDSRMIISTEPKLRENCVVLKEVILRESQKN
jgi:hypothetical protein